MRRKVIQLAEKTYVISLPSKWVRQWGIQKGDELELNEHGPKIQISTESTRSIHKCSVDIENTSERALRWLLSSLHKKGYDEIELNTADENQKEIISQLLKDLFVGFTIVHQSPQRCVIRSISQDSPEAFDTILRRAFLVTLDFGEQLSEELRKGEFSKLNQLIHLEKSNNQLTNFCQRILNKRGEPIKSTFLYVIVWNLEKIADDYKYLCQHLMEHKKVGKETINYLDNTNKILRNYYELFYKFDLQKLNKISKEFKQLKKEISAMIAKSEDALALSHLLHLLLKTADFSASIYALNN